jgi:peptidoglycan/xylan/chitin deacetylase (PgdA/CDA1 family)
MKSTYSTLFTRCIAIPAILFCYSIVNSCQFSSDAKAAIASPGKATTAVTDAAADKPLTTGRNADAAAVLAKPEVPILCYHQVREWKPTDSKTARDYIVPPANFREQMKALADSGYHTILPDQLYNYLTAGAALPSKPILLTFDDTDLEQFTVAAPEMKKYGFKGVFFIMTVSLGRPRYMTTQQVKQLSDEGHVIGSHTWDHHNVKQYQPKDWTLQLEKPVKQLEAITGKPVKYFAYPFGLWNEQAIPYLKQNGMLAAFQLASKRDQRDPLYTIRRIIIPSCTPASFRSRIKNSFKN